MGYYINPKTGTKEQWLAENAKPISHSEAKNFDFTKGHLPVVLVDNGAFTAAGIAYDHAERDEFMRPDGRPTKWFTVERNKLKEWYHG